MHIGTIVFHIITTRNEKKHKAQTPNPPPINNMSGRHGSTSATSSTHGSSATNMNSTRLVSIPPRSNHSRRPRGPSPIGESFIIKDSSIQHEEREKDKDKKKKKPLVKFKLDTSTDSEQSTAANVCFLSCHVLQKPHIPSHYSNFIYFITAASISSTDMIQLTVCHMIAHPQHRMAPVSHGKYPK